MTRSSSRTHRFGSLHEIKEINVMPLVDLLLQLFIAVVIFFPVVEYGMNVNLPKGTTDTIKREQTRTVSVDKQGRVYLNDVAKTMPQLTSDLKFVTRNNPNLTILLKGDAGINYGEIMKVFTQLHAAGITRIALMTQEESPSPRLSRR